jgi:hypothetical protein
LDTFLEGVLTLETRPQYGHFAKGKYEWFG